MFNNLLINSIFLEKYFKEIIRQQNILKANMWQYTDALQELTTSINNLVANNNVNQVQEEISFLQMFDFPARTEEDLARVEEYLNLEKNFNVAVIFYKCLLFSNICYIFTLQCYYMYFIN